MRRSDPSSVRRCSGTFFEKVPRLRRTALAVAACRGGNKPVRCGARGMTGVH